MRLLITRPADDAATLGDILEARGHEVVIEPLTEIEPVAFEIPATPIAALVLTSRYGARALAGHRRLADIAGLPAYCVGGATARAAADAGLGHVVAGDGTAAALAARIIDDLRPEAGDLVHIRGHHGRPEPASGLRRAGYTVHDVVAYEALASDRLSPRTREALARGQIDGVLLFSPRAARILSSLVEREKCAAGLDKKAAYCLSRAVADGLTVPGMEVFIAPRPERHALIDLVGDAPGRSH